MHSCLSVLLGCLLSARASLDSIRKTKRGRARQDPTGVRDQRWLVLVVQIVVGRSLSRNTRVELTEIRIIKKHEEILSKTSVYRSTWSATFERVMRRLSLRAVRSSRKTPKT